MSSGNGQRVGGRHDAKKPCCLISRNPAGPRARRGEWKQRQVGIDARGAVPEPAEAEFKTRPSRPRGSSEARPLASLGVARSSSYDDPRSGRTREGPAPASKGQVSLRVRGVSRV